MVFLGLIVYLVLGVFFAWCNRGRLAISHSLVLPGIGILGIFYVLAILPATLYLCLFYEQWSFLYIRAEIPLEFGILATFLHGAALLGGWSLGARWIRRAKERYLFFFAVITSIILVFLIGFMFQRLAVSGTFVEFQNGDALGLFHSKLGFVLIPLAVGWILASVLVASSLHRDSNRVRSR